MFKAGTGRRSRVLRLRSEFKLKSKAESGMIVGDVFHLAGSSGFLFHARQASEA